MKRYLAGCLLVALVLPLAATSTQARSSAVRVTRSPGTAAPVFVRGITDVIRPGPPAVAARAYLAENEALYGIDVAGSNLRVLDEIFTPGSTTVRFGQTVGGVPVLGAQYLVHMASSRAGHSVESVNGHFFTALEEHADPAIDAATAAMLARSYVRPMMVERVIDRGLVLLARGPGQLVHHVTVWGSRMGVPAAHDVFIDAHSGAIAGSIDALRHDEPAVGTGIDAHGKTVPLNVFQRGSSFELRDRARQMFTTDGGEITTHDVSGSQDFVGTNTNLVRSSSSSFSGEASASGAVDAHWGAGETYEFYKALGRNSIDDHGMSIVSSVDASDPDFGGPMYNAFWDSVTKQMVYGNPNREQLYPISADLDIVAHELTHGVTEFTADLQYIYQSGAMNEAYSDYFGNAIDVTSSGTPMTASGAGYIGEDICKVPAPENWECPLRDLNDGSTVADFGYYLPDLDSGGVHLNSTVFAGALWDIRDALGATADRYVYKALAEYHTPLDDFVEGRESVLAAAQALGAPASDIQIITQAFDAKGIVAGWERSSVTIDSTVLVHDVTAITELCPVSGGQPRTSGSRYVFADYTSDAHLCRRSADIYAGRLPGGATKLGSAGAFVDLPNGSPDIAGRKVVWTRSISPSRDRFDIDVRLKVIGGSSKTIAGGKGLQWFPAIDGNLLVWENFTNLRGTDIKARTVSGRTFTVSSRNTEEYLPQVAGDWIAWWDQGARLATTPTIRAKNVRTGDTMRIGAPPGTKFIGPPSLSDDHMVWYQDDDADGIGAILTVRLGGGNVTTLVAPTDPNPPIWDPSSFFLPVPAVNGGQVVYTGAQRSGATVFGRDLFIVPLAGGIAVPVTENRGDQAYPALASGRRVLWLDASLGRADLMTRLVP